MEPLITPKHFDSGYLTTESFLDGAFAERILRKIANPDFSEYFGKPVDIFDTVVISDIHLGNKFSRAQELMVLLKTVRFKRLIINGDVFDDMNMKRLNRNHWRIFSRLRELSDRHNNIEVIWIRGNHDGYFDLISKLLGIEFLPEYLFEWNGKKVLTIHGDIFDKFVSSHQLIGNIAGMLYELLLYFDSDSRKLGNWIKKNSKVFKRNLQKVREGAAAYARHKRADVVICGHTHYVEEATVKGIRYLNSGSWADTPAHFVGITDDQIKLVPFI